MSKKYELVRENTIQTKCGRTLYQIRALRNILINPAAEAYVLKGTLGGYIESEDNLSQDGECWIEKRSQVFQDARVKDDAYVSCSLIFGDAVICDNAIVEGVNFVMGDSIINADTILQFIPIIFNSHISLICEVTGCFQYSFQLYDAVINDANDWFYTKFHDIYNQCFEFFAYRAKKGIHYSLNLDGFYESYLSSASHNIVEAFINKLKNGLIKEDAFEWYKNITDYQFFLDRFIPAFQLAQQHINSRYNDYFHEKRLFQNYSE